MSKLTLKQKAGRANLRSRACEKCLLTFRFEHDTQNLVCERCSNSFREAYEKGYKQAKKELSSNT